MTVLLTSLMYHTMLYDIYIGEVIKTVIIANYTKLPTLLVFITINSQVGCVYC